MNVKLLKKKQLKKSYCNNPPPTPVPNLHLTSVARMNLSREETQAQQWHVMGCGWNVTILAFQLRIIRIKLLEFNNFFFSFSLVRNLKKNVVYATIVYWNLIVQNKLQRLLIDVYI